MKNKIRIFYGLLLVVFLAFQSQPVYAQDLFEELQATSMVLMEASTGEVIYEREADAYLSPASITKLMTLYLIFEELDEGNIRLEDEVVTSAYAKSMGGSQVFLEEGEVQTVDTLIKCIAVSSGNDACVAMAEYIAGSEKEFVNQMNETAASLGMKHSHFEDCCGLSDSDKHYMSARDVALIARQLITKYPQIYEYSSIWMEDITHTTKKGTSAFTLSNTNKLLKQYEYTTGLKTGSTDKAKYCFCGTARKDEMDLIAVIMAAPTSNERFQHAQTLLEYGFHHCSIYRDEVPLSNATLRIVGALKEQVPVESKEAFVYLNRNKEDGSAITKEVILPEVVEAPVKKGEVAGTVRYLQNGKEIGMMDIVYAQEVPRATFADCIFKVFGIVF